MAKVTPQVRVAARAFRIWAFAAPKDWVCSFEEVEEATGIDAVEIRSVIRSKGWGGRFKRPRGQAGHLRAHLFRRGYDMDENSLDLTEIISSEGGHYADTD